MTRPFSEACVLRRHPTTAPFRWGITATVLGSIGMIALALRFWGAAEFRADWSEVLLPTFLGGLQVLAMLAAVRWLGVDVEEDAIAQRNPSVLVASWGAVFASAAIIAGSNIGEGPSFENNLFCMGLGLGWLLLCWFAFEMRTRASRAIVEDRDFASGLRLAGLLAASGLILGRALAGDWHSHFDTLKDLAREGWPAAALWLAASTFERRLHPTPIRPSRAVGPCGALPATIYALLAIAWLFHLGAWEAMRR